MYENFKNVEDAFSCPFCQSDMTFQKGASLVCRSRHCFDLSKYGYLNFLQKQIKTPYNKELFESRRRVFEANFYDDLIRQLKDLIKHYGPKPEGRLLDAGCGEGFFTNQLASSDLGYQVLAVDIEKEAIKMGARGGSPVKFFVGDLSKLPLQSSMMDVVVNIFSPASYEEFRRILTVDGLVVKVVPNENYLVELREKAKDHLFAEAYSNEQVIKLFETHLTVLHHQRLTYTLPLTPEVRSDFVAMTPMMFHVDHTKLDLEAIKTITIDVDVLVGKFER